MVLDSEPAILDDLIVPLRELLVAALAIAVVVRLADRIRRATRLLRRTLAAVLAVAMLRTFDPRCRRLGCAQPVPPTRSCWSPAGVIALGLPAICIGFLLGLLAWQSSHG